MNSTRTVAVRLDNQVAQEYERLAQLKGDKLGTYLRELLTNNLHMTSIERQVSRIETLVGDFEKEINLSLDKFTETNYLNSKFFEDFAHMYMFHIGTFMHMKIGHEEIRSMQRRGNAYAEAHYLSRKKA